MSAELDTTIDVPMTWYQRNKTKALVALGSATPLVGMASAATLNESISPILNSVTELFTPLLNMVVAAVPLIIAIAIIGFILGILDSILSKLRV